MAKGMRDLLLDELRDIYSAEQQVVQVLPGFAQAARSAELKEAFEFLLGETGKQINRLCEIFETLGEAPEGNVCLAMEGLVGEANKLFQEGFAPEVFDAALIGAAQKMAHYEVAAYRALRTYAQACGLSDIARHLDITLEEEAVIAEKLGALADRIIDPAAASPSAA